MKLRYKTRRDAFERERVWSFDSEALSATEPVWRLRFDAIKELRLTFAPSRIGADVYECRIKGRTGEKAVISSQDFRGLLDIKSQAAEYSEFVRGLIAAAAQQRGITFRAGATRPGYAAAVIVMGALALVAAALIAAALGFWDIGGRPGAVKPILALVLFLVFLPWFWKNRSRNFDPNNPPAELFP